MVQISNLTDIIPQVREFENTDYYEQSTKIYFLRNFTIEMIEPYLKYNLYSNGIKPEVIFGEYDVINQELLDPQSNLHKVNPEIIILAMFMDNFVPELLSSKDELIDFLSDLDEQFELLLVNTDSLIILNTFIPSMYSEWGIASLSHVSKSEYIICKINQHIREYVSNHSDRFFLVDWERLIRILGEENSIDYRFWYSSRAPFKNAFLDLYSREITKIVRALKGLSKKCVILDCDNTLWGGVVGEDGLDGIKLDKHSYPGRVFFDFQKNLLYLYERGVLITLCSKNNEEDVWEVLDNHPYSLLKRSHLTGWRINWENKVKNIESLARELNIGLDSMVLVDDSPVECGQVKQYLPDVTVITVPQKLYIYPPLLLRDGLFDTLNFSSEDKNRTQMYQFEARRKQDQKQFSSIDDYLASLELVETIHPIRPGEIARVAQLTQKTNQFNLTTRRYSEADIKRFADDPDAAIYVLYVNDRYGEYGLTGILIARFEDHKCILDSFLLSCRILGRKLEKVFVFHCMKEIIKSHNISQWQAEYIPSKKNQQVMSFWEDMGFTLQSKGNGIKKYSLATSEFKPEQIDFIKIVEE